jgi:hypothetical protein
MVIVERVKDLPPIFASSQEFHLAQSAQLMRHGRLGHAELRRDLAHVHFTIKQNGNDPQAGRVAQGGE